MAVIVADRVTEQTATVGTGSFALLGAYASYRPFSAVCAIGDTFHYTAIAVDAAGAPTGQWETGLGTYSAANTVARSVRSSSSANALVDFFAGFKQVSIAHTTAALAVTTAETAAAVAAAAAVDARVDGLESVAGSRLSYSTYAVLATNVSAPANTSAEVPPTDTGTHTDPVVGGVVNNTGIFSWSVSPAGWQRISDVDALSAKPYADAAAASAASLDDKFPNGAAGTLAFGIEDAVGKVAFGVDADGTVRAADIRPDTLSIGDDSMIDEGTPGYVWGLKDGTGQVALGLRSDGTLEAAALVAASIESPTIDALSPIDRFGGVYPWQLNFIVNAGQSLAKGPTSGITTVQEYDNVGFPYGASSASTLLPLTVANCGEGGTSEPPMFGALGFTKALIAKEQGLVWEANDYQLAAANYGVAGSTIDALSPGGVSGKYEASIAQVGAGKALADLSARSFGFAAVYWTQGEADELMAKATYKGKLKTLAANFNTDGKAQSGQARDVPFILYQLCRTAALNTVTPAQIEASEEVAYIHIATPTYFMAFTDGTHLDATSSKWLGGYYGLVFKRVVIDGDEWAPLKPVQHSVLGNTIDLTFNREGLAFDTTLMPAQTNMGFTVFDGAASAVTISSVAIIAPNRVRITCASAPQTGWTVKYGHIAVTGKANYTGPGGNLRDSQGDTMTYAAIGKAMHNWSIVFSREI